MNSKTELIYLINRVCRFLYASALTLMFFEDNLFAAYFFSEGLIPFATIFAMRFKLPAVLTLMALVIILVFNLEDVYYFYALLSALIMAESITATRYFGGHRFHNVLIDLFHSIILLAVLALFYKVKVVSLVEFVEMLLLVSTLRLIYFLIYTSNKRINHGFSAVNSTVYRLTVSQFMRVALVSPASSEWFVIAFRALNQVVLYLWSFIKSNLKLEIPGIVNNVFFQPNWVPPLLVLLFFIAYFLIENILTLFIFYAVILCYLVVREFRSRFQ